MDVKQGTNFHLTTEEQGQLLLNIQYLATRHSVKFSTQEFQEMDRALTLKAAHQHPKLLHGAITLLVVHAIRKKLNQRYKALCAKRQTSGQVTLTVAEWTALREILLYHPWDSILLRTSLGKVDQSLPMIHPINPLR